MQNTVIDSYQNPLAERYASKEISYIFSPQFKHSTWRRLWVSLAEAEKELGLPISSSQIEELKESIETIDFEAAAIHEQKFQHDVMAHIHTYGDQCPGARSIIHLGATSCFVTDNTDIIQIKEALLLILNKIHGIIAQLAAFAKEHKELPCLGYTHLQPAQLTTVGKRASLWLQDLVMDAEEISLRHRTLKFLGVKGATGTQASFLALFNNDPEKVKKLEELIAEKMGFDQIFPVSGQTYTRKQDVLILNTLAGFASTCHKFGTDIRLLAGFKELLEPFSKHQVGSTAMPYKRNPILSERICSLSRYLISLAQNPLYTHATQWLERSLDDSANRRLCIAEAFLTADALADLMLRITRGLVVDKQQIDKNVQRELPYMAAENILMAAVKKGGDRQDLHERIRQHSFASGTCEGKNLIDLIAEDPLIPLERGELKQLIDLRHFIGRAPEQVEEFLSTINVLKKEGKP